MSSAAGDIQADGFTMGKWSKDWGQVDLIELKFEGGPPWRATNDKYEQDMSQSVPLQGFI